MKTNLKIALSLTSIFCLSTLLVGCSDPQAPIQTTDFSLADVKSIIADYDGESITIKESTSDKIIVVEHMDKAKKSYFAKVVIPLHKPSKKPPMQSPTYRTNAPGIYVC